MLSPLVQAGALQNSQSPVDTEGGGDGDSMEPFAIPPLVNFAHFPKVNTALVSHRPRAYQSSRLKWLGRRCRRP